MAPDCADRKNRRADPARLLLVALGVLGIAAPAAGDPDAPYVPTVREDVELMMELAEVGPGDYLIDLGSGDGRIVIAGARRGAFGHGVEIEPELVELAERNAVEAGVTGRAAFIQGDVFEADIAEATVVTMYLFPDVNIALRPRLIAELEPGTRVLSNSFDMGEWLPDVHDMSARSSGGILMWIVPADVAGDWVLELDGDAHPAVLRVEQRFQHVELDLAGAEGAEDESWRIESATLRGDRLAFHAVGPETAYTFSGRADGDGISGFAHIRDADGERVTRWSARRR